MLSPEPSNAVTATEAWQRCWLLGAVMWSAGFAGLLFAVGSWPWVLLVAVPVTAVIAVAVLLAKHPGVAWGVTAVFLGWCALTLFMLGMLLLPAAFMLVLACYMRTLGR